MIILGFVYVTKENVVVGHLISGIICVPCNDVCLQGRRDSPMVSKNYNSIRVQLGSSATWQCFENQYSYLKLDLVSMLKEHCDTETGLILPSFPCVL